LIQPRRQRIPRLIFHLDTDREVADKVVPTLGAGTGVAGRHGVDTETLEGRARLHFRTVPLGPAVCAHWRSSGSSRYSSSSARFAATGDVLSCARWNRTASRHTRASRSDASARAQAWSHFS